MSTSLGGYGGMGSSTGSKPLKGTGYKAVSTLSPEQMQLFQSLFSGSQGGISSGLSNLSQMAAGGSEDYWKQLEAPAMRQFGELQGQIASRFSGAGMGGRRSSGFHNALNSEATDLAERLQSQRLGLQQQAIRDLLGLSQSLLGRETQAFMPKQKPFWQELLGSAASGIGQGIGSLPLLAM